MTTDDKELTLQFLDGRKLQIPLYDRIVPDTTSYNFKNYRCIIKLLKHDPTIEWPFLDVSINNDHIVELVQNLVLLMRDFTFIQFST